MFCAITTGMLMFQGSIANLPCSDFAQVESPQQVASLDPSKQQEETKMPVLSPAGNMNTIGALDPKHTAIYDISARTVILPSGEKLEAHSGLGKRLDDPDAVKVKAKGPTPPGHYKLSLRERLFHKIRALRLNPVDEDKMFGRDGILAHPYMLGSRGDSFGCVSLKNYDKFLQQYLSGKVTDVVVVKSSNDLKHYASTQ